MSATQAGRFLSPVPYWRYNQLEGGPRRPVHDPPARIRTDEIDGSVSAAASEMLAGQRGYETWVVGSCQRQVMAQLFGTGHVHAARLECADSLGCSASFRLGLWLREDLLYP